MKVTNSSAQVIKVSISHWGTEGKTGDFALKPGDHDTWERSDGRGFIMVVKKTAAQRPYYIQAKSDIIVSDDKVTDGGSTLDPLA